MKLSLPFFEKKEQLSYFLVLVLRNTKASAVIFEESGGVARVVNKHDEHFKENIETASEEELLEVLDKTISKAENKLPQNVETQKTVFGVKEDWIENSRIKKEYLAKLKKVSDELGLIPIGFIITTEAIANLLSKEEGAPISAILCEIDRNYASISLIRAGKIIESKNSKIEDSPAKTVDTLLKHFENVEIFPSRIIIFNGEKDLSQDFINHSWSKDLPFLHLPQTTNLDLGFDAKAVLFGAASEMGFEVLDSKNLKEPEIPQDLGIIDQEKEEIEETKEPTTNQAEETIENASAEYFGFVKDKDVSEFEIPRKNIQKDIPLEEIEEQIKEIPEELQVENSESKSLPQNAFLILIGMQKILTSFLRNLKSYFSKIKFPSNLPISKGGKIIFIPIFIIILLFLGLLIYLFGRNATITLSIDGKKVSQTRDVTFSTSLPTDESKNIIAAQFVDASEDGSATTNATGNKDIGTPAKGTVTIFNQNLTSINVPANTTITSSNNLKYTIDKSITVASASAQDKFSPTNPGTASVSVTAADIGTNYNIPSNTKFSFTDASIAAKNDNAFSGGTQKSITVVSKDDITKLESDLIKNLEQKAKDDITKKISGDKVLLPGFVSEALTNKSTDKNVGDEASSVTLKATVDYKSIAYNKNDINSFAQAALETNANNLQLDKNNIKTNATNIKAKDNQISTTLEISGFLLPKIDQQSLVKQVRGKGVSQIQNLLMNTIPQIANVNIKISPNIPLFPKTLPGSTKIKFVINTNE